MQNKDILIMLSLIGALFYFVYSSKNTSPSPKTAKVIEHQTINKRQPSTSYKIINKPAEIKDNTEDDYIDPSYLEFSSKREAYKNHNNEGYIDAGANPYSNNSRDLSHLRDKDILNMQDQELAQREEDMATEELDWDKYTNENSNIND